MPNEPFKLAGLFSGVGGIELGFQKAGFLPVLANELDKNASVTYRLNHTHELITGDVQELQPKQIPKIDVLTAGFPCQAFSVAGYRNGFDDPRGNLFWEIVRIIKVRNPQVIFLENVKNLVSHDGGNTFQVIREALEELGYTLKVKVMNASEYSAIPQNRERIYIVGFRKKSLADAFRFPAKLNRLSSLSKFIDFQNRVDDSFYYEDRYMSKTLRDEILRTDTVYQWRRQYVRENKSGLCPTLTANMGTGGHNVPLILTPFGIRKLTPNECFHLMGFPRSFKLPQGMANSHLYKQAGNAVVVPVIERIAKNIQAALNGEPMPSSGPEDGDLFG